MFPRSLLAVLVFGLVAIRPAAADVLIVDGTGTHYGSVQVAVYAAHDGDVLLVRVPVNESVLVNAKGIAIVADTPDRLTWMGYLHVQNVPVGRTFLVSGFALGLVSSTPLVFSGNSGSIRVQDCLVSPVGAPGQPATVGIVCTASLDVAFLQCTLGGGSSPGYPWTPGPGAAALSATDSTIAIQGTSVRGGSGLPGTYIGSGYSSSGTSGGPGVLLSGGSLVLQSSVLRGGSGGAGYPGNCSGVSPSAGGAGGTGLVLSAGALARAIGGRSAGGVGGLGGVNPCGQAPDGAHGALVDASGGTWSESAGAPRAFLTPRVVRVGQPLPLNFSGAPGERALLALSSQAAYIESVALDGVLLLLPPLRRLDCGILDTYGLLALMLTTPALPPGTVNDLLQLQPVMDDGTGQLHLGCAGVVVRVESWY